MQRSRMARFLLRSMILAMIVIAGFCVWVCTPVVRDYWTVRNLLKQLEGPAEEDRESAARSLAKIGPRAAWAVPALIRRLREEERGNVRGAIALALPELGDVDEVAPALIDSFGSSGVAAVEYESDGEEIQWSPDWQIVEALASLRPRVVPHLIDAFEGASSEKRIGIALVLSTLGKEAADADPVLHTGLNDANDKVRISAARALDSISGSDESVIEALTGLLKSKSLGVRINAAQQLGNIGRPASSAVSRLIEALDDPDEMMQRTAANALARFGPSARAGVASLISALKYERIRGCCMWAPDGYDTFSSIGPDALPVLVETVLSHDDPDIRSHAIDAIAMFGNESGLALGAILEATEDPTAAVRNNALSHAISIGDRIPQVASAIRRALADPDPDVRVGGIRVLHRRELAAVDWSFDVSALLADPNAGVRWAAFQWFAENDSESAELISVIRTALRDESDSVRRAALERLREFNDSLDLVSDEIRQCLSDDNANCRQCAQVLLWQLEPDSDATLQSLIEFVERTSYGYDLRKALERLGSLGPAASAAVPALLRLVDRDICTEEAVAAFLAISPATKEITSRLEKMLAGPDKLARIRAAELLFRCDSSRDLRLATIKAAVHDGTRTVRRSALNSAVELAVSGVPGARSLVAAAIRDRSAAIRADAMALADWGNFELQDRLNLLSTALHDHDRDVQLAAIGELEKLGPAAERAIPALVELSNDPRPSVRRAAATAINYIQQGSQDDSVSNRSETIQLVQGDWSTQLFTELARRGESAVDALPAIIEKLPSADDYYYDGVVTAVKAMGPRVIGPLRDAVTRSDSPETRRLVLKLMVQLEIDSGELTDILIDRLSDDSAAVRGQAAFLIGLKGSDCGDTVRLNGLLSDGDPFVRGAAVYALGKLGARTAADLMRVSDLVDDPNPFVRSNAKLAIARLGDATP